MQSADFNDDLLDQIIYRGEGNSSIVIALKNKSKVIRLLKKDGKLMRSSQDHHVTQHPMRSIQFIHLIMKPLTSPFMSEATELAHLKSEFINMLSKRVEAERPSHRLDKTLHLDDQYALIMDDLCALPDKLISCIGARDLSGPTLSVEIKPKQGFLPQLNRLVMRSNINDPITAQIKGHCLYGLTQYFKISRGRISEASNYCPINLFSGCPVRMKDALEALLRHPQNNLRIFKDLTLAYDETNQQKLPNLFDSFFRQDPLANDRPAGCSLGDRFIDILIQCLLSEPGATNDECDNIDLRYKDNENLSSNIGQHDTCIQHPTMLRCRRCDIHANSMPVIAGHRLPQSCVLASVLRAQKLDSIGPFEARHMLEWLLEEAKTSESGIDVLEELSKPQMPDGFGSPSQLPSESRHDYYFRKVWEFLVSLTAKDCSIMITMRKVEPTRLDAILRRQPEVRNYLLQEHGTGNHYLFNVGIADFDQKMPLKIMRICDNLQQIVTQTRFNENPKKEISPIQAKNCKKIIVGSS